MSSRTLEDQSAHLCPLPTAAPGERDEGPLRVALAAIPLL
jgi:hypothetical protein